MKTFAKPLLYIEPKNYPKSRSPHMDIILFKMFYKLKNKTHEGVFEKKSCEFISGLGYKGVHTCICGEKSSSHDYLLDNGFSVNSLCLHYLAYHRDEIPENEIDIIHNFEIDQRIDINEYVTKNKDEMMMYLSTPKEISIDLKLNSVKSFVDDNRQLHIFVHHEISKEDFFTFFEFVKNSCHFTPYYMTYVYIDNKGLPNLDINWYNQLLQHTKLKYDTFFYYSPEGQCFLRFSISN